MCLTTVILPPGASEVGLGAAAPAALWAHWALKALNSARSFFVRRRATWEPFARNWGPFWTQSHPKLPLGAQGVPNGPTESQRSQREAKVMPRRAPWEPKAPKRRPKVVPRRAKWFPKTPKINKSENYIHINKIHANSRSTAIQRPTSNCCF